eukprot:360365-Chlamydomonas_euryale.AAC.14
MAGHANGAHFFAAAFEVLPGLVLPWRVGPQCRDWPASPVGLQGQACLLAARRGASPPPVGASWRSAVPAARCHAWLFRSLCFRQYPRLRRGGVLAAAAMAGHDGGKNMDG